MITNLKVDIIYYKTSSDFELEFNLSGCCRMRILKDNIKNSRELVNALARDVARSRIILMVSDLFGDKNGVETLCAAIGYKYLPADKSAHSIKTGDEIYMPTGALPLVTKSGQYGGFIVECGQQSIIVVSSDRNLRHEIMRSYIHQYIFDINQVDAYNERLRHENEHNPIIDNSNILSSARQDLMQEQSTSLQADESVKVSAAKGVTTPDEISTVSQNKDDEAEPSKLNKYAENENISKSENTAEELKNKDDASYSEAIEEIISHTSGFNIPKVYDQPSDAEEEKSINKRLVRRRKGGNIALLIIAILLLVCFGVLAYYMVYLPLVTGNNNNSVIKILEDIL